jgi:hypothetical protein
MKDDGMYVTLPRSVLYPDPYCFHCTTDETESKALSSSAMDVVAPGREHTIPLATTTSSMMTLFPTVSAVETLETLKARVGHGMPCAYTMSIRASIYLAVLSV